MPPGCYHWEVCDVASAISPMWHSLRDFQSQFLGCFVCTTLVNVFKEVFLKNISKRRSKGSAQTERCDHQLLEHLPPCNHIRTGVWCSHDNTPLYCCYIIQMQLQFSSSRAFNFTSTVSLIDLLGGGWEATLYLRCGFRSTLNSTELFIWFLPNTSELFLEKKKKSPLKITTACLLLGCITLVYVLDYCDERHSSSTSTPQGLFGVRPRWWLKMFVTTLEGSLRKNWGMYRVKTGTHCQVYP